LLNLIPSSEKVQPVKAKERRTTYPQVPFETTSPDAFAYAASIVLMFIISPRCAHRRRNYEEGWDSRFSAWPGAVDPTWHGGPLPDPTYWDASGPAYDPGAGMRRITLQRHITNYTTNDRLLS